MLYPAELGARFFEPRFFARTREPGKSNATVPALPAGYVILRAGWC